MQWNRWRRLAATLVLASCFGGAALADCVPADWPRDESIAAEFARSKHVVVGRVVSETWLDDAGRAKPLRGPLLYGCGKPCSGFDDYGGVIYRVRVDRLFKGPSVRWIDIVSENDVGRTPLSPGDKDILFVFRRKTFIGERNVLNPCGNSFFPTSRPPAMLRELRRLAR